MDFKEKEKQRKKEKGVVGKLVGADVSEMTQRKIDTNIQLDNSALTKKKPGRPKVNREKKDRYTLTLMPSNHDKAAEIAYQEGKSVSELVDEYLAQYVRKNADMLNE